MGNDHRHYVPILKAKAGERRALRQTKWETKCCITPLVELVPDTGSTVAAGAELVREWGVKRPLMLDGRALGQHGDGNKVPFLEAAEEFQRLGGAIIPVVSPGCSEEFLEAVRHTAKRSGAGVCIRLEDESLSVTLPSDVESLVSDLEADPAEVDIVIDLKEVAETDRHRSSFVASAAINMLPGVHEWRMLVLAGSSFPYVTPSGSGIHAITRVEWGIWRNLVAAADLRRLPAFGDYAVQNPRLVKATTDVMILSPTIRYADDESWLIFKGSKPKVDNPWALQMRDLCKTLLDHPAFVHVSWGDQYIVECAGGSENVGGATEWRAVGTSHHIGVVTRQIANLFGS